RCANQKAGLARSRRAPRAELQDTAGARHLHAPNCHCHLPEIHAKLSGCVRIPFSAQYAALASRPVCKGCYGGLIGPLATIDGEPRQARKGATVAVDSCAGVWLMGLPPLPQSLLAAFARTT